MCTLLYISRQCGEVRPPLEITFLKFLVDRPGELISAEWVHFFSFRESFPSIFPMFYIQKKIYLKIIFPASRLAIILGIWCRVPTLVLKVLKGLKLIFKNLRP